MARPDNAVLKRALRQSFPATPFRVFSGRGTARSWTHIGWTDGPSEARVTDELARLGAARGHMDLTDYFDGERVSCSRKMSETAEDRIAGLLLAPKPVPPRDLWVKDVCAEGHGWYNLLGIVWRAGAHRADFDRYRFEAHAWLAAVTAGTTTAPRVVCYA